MEQEWERNGCRCRISGSGGCYCVSVVLKHSEYCEVTATIPRVGLKTKTGGVRHTFSTWKNAVAMANGYADLLGKLNDYEYF